MARTKNEPENGVLVASDENDSRAGDDLPQLKKEETVDVEKHGQADLSVHSGSDVESVGRQIELEAENSIKYRTCSWQKVSLSTEFFFFFFPFANACVAFA